jgi:hypothetical protein
VTPLPDLTSARIAAGYAVLLAIATRDDDVGNTLLWLPQDDFLDLPEHVQERCENRVQRRPVTMPRFALPANVLARYALGHSLGR